LTLLFERNPDGYRAQLGTHGWLETWGWTVEEALDQLARILASDRSRDILPDAAMSCDAIRCWLADNAPLPMFDDEHLVLR